MYTSVSTSEGAAAPPKKKKGGFGFFSSSTKPSRDEAVATERAAFEMAKATGAGTVLADPEGGKLLVKNPATGELEHPDANFALGSVHRAEMIVKLLAIMQNPHKIFEIVNAKNFKEGMSDHYGTEDPMEVSKMILHDLQDGIRKGAWSVGRLAFFGGCYGTVSGILDLLPPASIFMVFTPLAGLSQLYMLIFGIITMTVESSGDTISSNLKAGILKYCAALEFMWGRGLFYTYIGITCILGPVETIYGWYMFLVGITMIVMYVVTSRYIIELGAVFHDDSEIETAFKKYSGTDGVLNRHELGRLLHDVGMELNHQEMELMFKRLDPDHDGYITLSELKNALGKHKEQSQVCYTIGPMPPLDPRKGDQIKLQAAKNKDGSKRTDDGHHAVDWNKVKRSV